MGREGVSVLDTPSVIRQSASTRSPPTISDGERADRRVLVHCRIA
jgi:hypothetical protein